MVLKENEERRAFNCLKVLLEERKENFKGKIALHFKKKDFERSQLSKKWKYVKKKRWTEMSVKIEGKTKIIFWKDRILKYHRLKQERGTLRG